MKVSNIPQYCKMFICSFLRKKFIIPRQRAALKNKTFSIIASNCNGCVITSDLGIRFNSPTVNLSLRPKDFLKFVSHLDYYLKADLTEVEDKMVNYPVAMLDDLRIDFVHYKTFEEGRNKWMERRERVNFDNLYIMMTDRDGATDEDIENFDKLPFHHKVCFTAKPYPMYKSVIYCKEFAGEESVPVLSEWRNLKGERLYDKYFDYVSWLNEV